MPIHHRATAAFITDGREPTWIPARRSIFDESTYVCDACEGGIEPGEWGFRTTFTVPERWQHTACYLGRSADAAG